MHLVSFGGADERSQSAHTNGKFSRSEVTAVSIMSKFWRDRMCSFLLIDLEAQFEFESYSSEAAR
eukprot:17373-Eustigmatos_ZCMA.PRE.1